jgi:hypothetical protein
VVPGVGARRGVPHEVLGSPRAVGAVVVRGKHSRKPELQIGVHVGPQRRLGTVSWVGQNRLHRGVPQLEVPVRERTLVCRPQSAVGEVRIQILPVDGPGVQVLARRSGEDPRVGVRRYRVLPLHLEALRATPLRRGATAHHPASILAQSATISLSFLLVN